MSLVSGLINILGSLESDKLAVHKNRCIAIRNRNANCLRCAEACTSKVFSYVDGELKIDADRCIGCGTCATACPTCAIEIKKPSDEELAAAVKRSMVATGGRPIFACREAVNDATADAEQDGDCVRNESERVDGRAASKRERRRELEREHLGEPERESTPASTIDTEKVCVVPCLGRIDESLLISLAAYKAHGAQLVCANCESCEHAPGGEMIQEVVASAHSLLMAFDGGIPLELTTEMPEEAFAAPSQQDCTDGLSRRDLFKSLGQKSGNLAVAAAGEAMKDAVAPGTLPQYEKVNKGGTLSQHIPSRRTMVYNYLAHIGNPVLESVSSRIIGSVSIDADKCNSCRMCAVFCPTGALKKCGAAAGAGSCGTNSAAAGAGGAGRTSDEAETFGILHRPSLCVQCGLCQSICSQNAIEVSCEVPVMQFIGKEATHFEMKEPNWTPNKPDSMYNKFHNVLGEDLEMCMF